MDRFEFLIDWYHKENERKGGLDSSLNIPIIVQTGIFAVLFYLLDEYGIDYGSLSCLDIIFLVCLLTAIAFWFCTTYYLYRSYNNLFNGYEYQGLPYPTTLNKYFTELEEYKSKYQESLGDSVTTDRIFKNQLINMISGYLDVNIENNDNKARYLHNAKVSMLICIIIVFMSSIPFIFSQVLN